MNRGKERAEIDSNSTIGWNIILFTCQQFKRKQADEETKLYGPVIYILPHGEEKDQVISLTQ